MGWVQVLTTFRVHDKHAIAHMNGNIYIYIYIYAIAHISQTFDCSFEFDQVKWSSTTNGTQACSTTSWYACALLLSNSKQQINATSIILPTNTKQIQRSVLPPQSKFPCAGLGTVTHGNAHLSSGALKVSWIPLSTDSHLGQFLTPDVTPHAPAAPPAQCSRLRDMLYSTTQKRCNCQYRSVNPATSCASTPSWDAVIGVWKQQLLHPLMPSCRPYILCHS
jgi:hypothetical protein